MKPAVYIVCGQVGSGKTTTAGILSKLINVPVASVDQTIKKLFSKPSFVGKDQPPSPFELDTCYNAFALIADYLLSLKQSIIIDGAFAKKSQRDLLISVARKHNAVFEVFLITCPDEILKERAEKRFNDGTGVGYQAHLKIKESYEPLDIEHLVIDTSKDVEKQLKQIIKIKNS